MTLRTRSTRPRRRPAATALAALAAAALAMPVLTACSAVDKAMDCAHTAAAVANGVDKLQQTAQNAADHPEQTEKALDGLDRDLKGIGDATGDPDLTKALKRMNDGIDNARQAMQDGKNPDLQPLADAAGELTKVCTPG
ncbi:hypothetical protein OG422_10810 [Streptomyces sp. NBC_01525]|uniref:Secreted protein n=1 Tax=Streptomyces benahoarensis TaxID=2595054 RepID=A0A553YSE5_9ACTN|nr:hypothetical protein [Streptomyces benahoarensis]TSB17488.1 hypothetical protein FNJ62_27610 [Streptomyces benahoarensis]TSB31943.1 hypothetical protein FNZ23_25405 [Streptomyces benahoarensis]